MQADDPRHGTYAGHNAGCRQECCTTAARNYQKRRIYDLHNGIQRTVPALGAHRRLRALCALGWSFRDIADRSPVTRQAIHEWHRRDTITSRVHLLIASVYDEMSMMPPPQGQYADRQRSLAARRGWVPPLAWDDIDRDAEPRLCAIVHERAGRPETLPAVLEDFDWLTSAGESPEKAAARVGVALSTIDRYRLRQMERAS